MIRNDDETISFINTLPAYTASTVDELGHFNDTRLAILVVGHLRHRGDKPDAGLFWAARVYDVLLVNIEEGALFVEDVTVLSVGDDNAPTGAGQPVAGHLWPDVEQGPPAGQVHLVLVDGVVGHLVQAEAGAQVL